MKKTFILFCILALVVCPIALLATQKNRAAMDSEIASVLANSQPITAAQLRTVFTDTLDSAQVTLTDGQPLYTLTLSAIPQTGATSGQAIVWNGSQWAPATVSGGGGSGTVTSVALTAPSMFTVSGTPITTSGTLAISYSGTPLPVANGGTGTTTPGIVAGTNVTVSGTWPNQTVNATGGGGGGSGTVTTLSVVTANGLSGTVANATTTPAITLALGAITPTSVNGNTITTGSGTLTIGAAKTFTASNTLTLAGTDGSTLNVGTGGTLGTAAFATVGAASGVASLNSSGTIPTTQIPVDNATLVFTGGNLATGQTVGLTKYQAITAGAQTVTAGNNAIALTASLGSAITTTLPAASSTIAGGRVYLWDKAGTVTSSNTWSIARAGSDTINTATSPVIISTAYGGTTLVSDGVSNWTVLNTSTSSGSSTLLPTIIDAQSGGAVTMDLSTSAPHKLTLSGNLSTVNLTGFADGRSVDIEVIDPSTYTVTWGNSIFWPGTTQPVQTTTHADFWHLHNIAGTIIGSVTQNYPTAAAYNPATDSSVIEWLKADAITGVSNGGSLSTWQHSTGVDGIGGGNSLPVYNTGVKNGLPAVTMNDGGSPPHAHVTTASFATVTSPYVYWVVFKCVSPQSYMSLIDTGNATGGNTQLGMGSSSATWQFSAGTPGTGGTTDTNWHIARVVVNGSSSSVQFDGGTSIISTGNYGSNVPSGISLGNNPASYNDNTGWIIGEVIVQNAVPADSSVIWSYLDARWAVY